MFRPELFNWLRPFTYVPFSGTPNVISFIVVYIRNFVAAFLMSSIIVVGAILAGGDERALYVALPITILLSSSEEVARWQFSRGSDRPLVACMKFALIINAIELGATGWTMVLTTEPGSFFDWREFIQIRWGAFVLHLSLSALLYYSIIWKRALWGLVLCATLHTAFNLYMAHGLWGAFWR